MRSAVLSVIVLVEVAYLIAGGFVFWALESDREQEQKAEQRSFNLSGFLDNISAAYPCPSIENLTNFVDRILTLERSGLLQTKETNDWDIPGSIFFAMTVVTTIGYGNVTPKTAGGQVFCCFYAVLGIPFTMVMLLGVGEILKRLADRVRCRACEAKPRVHRVVHGASLVSLGVVLFILVPAAVFKKLEGWSYGSSVYYAIISTATVGFGDYVAAWSCVGNACWFYRIAVGVWIFFGLAWLAGVIGAIQDSFQTLLPKAAPKSKKNNSREEKEEKRNELQTTEDLATDIEDVSISTESIAYKRMDEDSKYKTFENSRL